MPERFITALEASKIVNDLYAQLRAAPFNSDLYRFHKNLTNMVSHLSSLEVEARQTRKDRKVLSYRKELNDSISYLEKMILIMRLME